MNTILRRDLLWNKSSLTHGSLELSPPQKNFLLRPKKENKTLMPSTRPRGKRRGEPEELPIRTDTEVLKSREKKELKKKKFQKRLS